MLFISNIVAKHAFLGINDLIVDPGFGFAKTLDQNYEILRNLNYFRC
jgi:dihydropteroate synthase